MAKISYMLINLGLFITSDYISPVFFDAVFHFLACFANVRRNAINAINFVNGMIFL